MFTFLFSIRDNNNANYILMARDFFQIFNFLSLTLNPLEGKLQQLTKEETICKLLATDSDKEKDHIFR